jgi:putative flippase GtrA
MQTTLLHRLEPLLSRLSRAQRLLLVQFLRFGIVGTLGFVWDISAAHIAKPFVGPYYALLISYVVAGTINWLLNRIWTYAGAAHSAPHRQLAMFLLANSVGLLLNRGVGFTLIANFPICRQYLVLPVLAGGLCGMFLNFYLSRRLVFR